VSTVSEGASRQALPQASRSRTLARRPAGSSLAFAAVVVFMSILLLAPQAIFPVLAPFRIALIAACIAGGAHILGCFMTGRPLSVASRELKLAGALFGWAVVTIPFSYWRGGSVEILTDLFFKSLVLFWLIANTVTTVRRFRVFALALMLFSVPIATTAVKNYLSGNFVASSDRIVGYNAPLTNNPNDLALTLNLIIPFVLVFVRASRGCFVRVFSLGILVLDVTAVLMTFSRTGFISLLTIMASLSWRLVKSRSLAWVFVLFVVLLAALPFLPASMWERWATITNIESDATGSAQARRDQVVGALKFIIWHPVVGTGIGTGILGLREQGAENWSAVHNAYLQQGVELGLPGMGLYLALVIASLKSATAGQERAGSTYEDSLARQLAQATRLSLIAFAVAAIFHPVAYHFYFYYLAGLAVASRSLAKDTD
jgi:hypothetical protein